MDLETCHTDAIFRRLAPVDQVAVVLARNWFEHPGIGIYRIGFVGLATLLRFSNTGYALFGIRRSLPAWPAASRAASSAWRSCSAAADSAFRAPRAERTATVAETPAIITPARLIQFPAFTKPHCSHDRQQLGPWAGYFIPFTSGA